jgi:hypothetical protein
MSGQIELQLVKMKFRTTGRPSFISSGSDTTFPSSRTSCTVGTAYRTDAVLMTEAGSAAGSLGAAPAGKAAASSITRQNVERDSVVMTIR